jgi:hypothetical protein
MAAAYPPSSSTVTSRAKRLPGRKPGSAQREEVLRIWDGIDDDGRKLILFFVRGLAREQGLVPAATPLVMTNRVF